MASSTKLEERFNIAVKTIQTLPDNGIIQPSNLTKLIFYGYYKQATIGPCKEPKPSVFNYIGRAKWEAWNSCQSMSKNQAMLAYVIEIYKIIKTMPQTNEILEFAKSIGLANKKGNKTIDVQLKENNSYETNMIKNDHNESSTSSSSLSSSLASFSDLDEFYDDPSDFVMPTYDEMALPTNESSFIHYNSSNASNDTNYSEETHRTILIVLTKLQEDIHNILNRLNQLETSIYLLRQKELSIVSQLDSSLRWLPLSGFRRGAIAFVLLWPFIAFILIRLFLRAKINIRIFQMASITSGGDSEHLGIPTAVFVEDVDSFMQQPENDSVDTVIKRLDDLNSKYRFMEMNLLQKKKRLRGKLPDIQICLDMIEQLRKYREKDTDMDTNFLLAHNVYGKATIPPTDKVCLWLGANVMLEYPIDEADVLLNGNQKTAQTTLTKVDEDLDFLRDQITTTEVNMARLHNWAVKLKQQNKK
ncbi:unnamed protein product, partial [Adineta steineri]